MKNKTFLLLIIFFGLSYTVIAQDGPFSQKSSTSFKEKPKDKDGDPDNNNGGGNNGPTNAPLDGGLAALLVVGAAYGIRRYKTNSTKEQATIR